MTNLKVDRPEICLRPVTESDQSFLVDLYGTTRADEMRLVPWTEEQKRSFVEFQFAAQQLHYREKYPHAAHHVILLDEESIGRLYVARLDDEIRIMDILLLPTYRNRGIGTRLLSDLVKEAEQQGKPLTIYVEDLSPSLQLFERLGFKQTQREGFRTLMERTPSVTDQPL